MRIVLASGSVYRGALLRRLVDDFVVDAPQIDETRHDSESPEALASRLAAAKTAAVAPRHADAVVIGSDQVAEWEGVLLGKPADHAAAVAQLSASSGQIVRFLTSVVVQNTQSGHEQSHLDVTEVRFRNLTADEIERYLLTEQPYDCAGSFKSEGSGIALFDRISSEDPTALVGLPLIWLAGALRNEGLQLP